MAVHKWLAFHLRHPYVVRVNANDAGHVEILVREPSGVDLKIHKQDGCDFADELERIAREIREEMSK